MNTFKNLLLSAIALNFVVACQNKPFEVTGETTASSYSPTPDKFSSFVTKNAQQAEVAKDTVEQVGTDTKQGIDLTDLNIQSGEHVCFLASEATGQILAKGVLHKDKNSSFSYQHSNGHSYVVNHTEDDGSGLTISVLETNPQNLSESRLLKMAQANQSGRLLLNSQYLISCSLSGKCGTFQIDSQNNYKAIQMNMDVPRENENPLLNKMGIGMRETALGATLNTNGTLVLATAERTFDQVSTPTQPPAWALSGLAVFGSNSIQLLDGSLMATCVQIPSAQ